MTTIHLTDPAINRATREAVDGKKRIDLTDSTQEGLRLRIGASGTRMWNLACRDSEGKFRLFPFGAYPAVGIADARDKARQLREEVRHGRDPIAEKRLAKGLGAAGQVSTLEDLLDTYKASRDAPKTWAHSEIRVRRVFAGLLRTRLSKLKPSHFQIAMDNWHKAPSAYFAGRNLRPVMKWAVKRGYAEWELTRIETKPANERDRVLSPDELTAILKSLKASPSMYARAMQFVIWTVCRLNETCNAKWQDVDFELGVWTVRETKNELPLVLKLPKQALDFLTNHKPAKSKPTDLIFPNVKGSNKPITNWDRFTKVLQKESKTAGWHRHDLRRTGATAMANDLGIDAIIVDSALNHKNIYSAALGKYIRGRPQGQVADALQKYADYLDKLSEPKNES